MPIPTAVTILPILFNVLTSLLPSFQVATFQMLPCQTISDCFFWESLSMRNSVLFCGKHKADNLAGSPSFQVLLLSLQVLDNSCNHLPLYWNPDHTLHQFNMLRGYAHLGVRIMILFQPVNYRLTQFLKLLCFTHSFSSPFFNTIIDTIEGNTDNQ